MSLESNNITTKSLYVTLGIIIVSIVTVIMLTNLFFTYIDVKDKTISEMKNSSKLTIGSLKDNVTNFISSYSINEYEKLVLNQMHRNDIFAIVVKDYNMGKILGKRAYISGKIRDKDWNSVDYISTNKKQTKMLKEAFFSYTHDLKNKSNDDIGTITIFISDDYMNKVLNKVIIENLIIMTVISLLLIVSLFFAIRFFILKPVSNIITVISNIDDDGVPKESIPKHGSSEILQLSNTIDIMISSINNSRAKLKDNESSLLEILNMSPMAVRVAKNKGKEVVFANKAYSKLIDTKEEDILGKNPMKYYLDDDMYNLMIKSLDEDKNIYNKLVSLKVKNNKKWVLASYININFNGEKAILGWIYDVTKEIALQTETKKQKEEFEAIFSNSKDGIAIFDLESNFLNFNDAYLKMTGFSREELLTKSCIGLTAPSDKEKTMRTLKTVLEVGHLENFEKSCIVKDDRIITINMSVTMLPDKKRMLATTKDVTQLKYIESQSKLASMGEMIGNIAHQWRQPLSVISMGATGMQAQREHGLLTDAKLNKMCDSINKNAQYLSRTIDDFRNFIKGDRIKTVFSLRDDIDSFLNLVEGSIKNNDIKVILSLERNIQINGYENELIQCLINIFNNAKDALKDLNDYQRLIFISSEVNDTNAIIKIKDNGGGVPSEILEKVFEPYFTTKHKSQGTGLGLHMTYNLIVDGMGGSIEVKNKQYNFENKDYTGAEFMITLPMK